MFKNITSAIKQYYEAMFLIIQTTDKMQYFTILQYKLHSFNIQDDRSTRGPLATPLNKKSLSHLYGQPVLTFAVWVFEWTLIELPSYIIKNLLCLFFIQWFYRCCRRIRTVFYSKDCQARFLKVTTLRRVQLLKDYTRFHIFYSLEVHRSSRWLQEHNTFSDLPEGVARS